VREENGMPTAERAIEVYLRLARACEGQAHGAERDGYLLLAAESAWACGRNQQAERLRFLLLKHNPNHLLKPYGSFAQAVESLDVQALIRQLRRQHPAEQSERLLRALEPKTEAARHGLTETPSRTNDKTRQELVLPVGTVLEPPDGVPGKEATPASAAEQPPRPIQKEVRKMAETNPPRPPIPDPRRSAPPVARPAGGPGVFNVAPDDRLRPRPAAAPIAGLSPPVRHEAAGGAIGLLLAIIVFLLGAAVFVLTFLQPFVPLGF